MKILPPNLYIDPPGKQTIILHLGDFIVSAVLCPYLG